MRGEELLAIRERLGWSRSQLVEALDGALGTSYGQAKNRTQQVGRWERDERGIPEGVAAFMRELEMETAAPSGIADDLERELEGMLGGEEQPPREDLPPPPRPEEEPGGQRPWPGSSGHAKVCEELWEMVATGCGLVGVVTGSEALKRDRDIILADKQALGRAYGKLAETNDTFRRMLLGVTGGGAWLEVAMVTGITVGKVTKNHSELRALERERSERRPAAEPVYGEPDWGSGPDIPEGAMVGDSGVVVFPPAAAAQ